MELKSNVKSLYRGDELLVPAIETADVSRIADNRNGDNTVLPVSAVEENGRDSTVTNNIN